MLPLANGYGDVFGRKPLDFDHSPNFQKNASFGLALTQQDGISTFRTAGGARRCWYK